MHRGARRRGERARRPASGTPAATHRGSPQLPGVSRRSTALERIAIVVVSFAVAIGAVVLLSGYFTARDQGGVTGVLAGPGLVYRDLGDGHLRPGQPRPVYDSVPPTSGAHVSTPVPAAGAVLSDDQILTALSSGDVILMYGEAAPPAWLARLARSAAGPFDRALAAAGQAVILARLPGLGGIVALGWTRLLPVAASGSVRARTVALLKQFIEAWLGRGTASGGDN